VVDADRERRRVSSEQALELALPRGHVRVEGEDVRDLLVGHGGELRLVHQALPAALVADAPVGCLLRVTRRVSRLCHLGIEVGPLPRDQLQVLARELR
jgi:hypothetical protein